jgi:hypothetical protein
MGNALRAGINLDMNETRFITQAGSQVRVPSFLVPHHRLSVMLQLARFAESNIDIKVHCLPKEAAPISPDVESAASHLKCPVHELPLLYTIVCRKG